MSRVWATRYDFPAIREVASSAMLFPTIRHRARRAGSSIHDGRNSRISALREAFINAFDFEWTNKKIMYGSYQRTHSVFQNSDMMAVGKPSAGRDCPARAIPRQGAR